MFEQRLTRDCVKLVTEYVADRINAVRRKGLGEYHATTLQTNHSEGGGQQFKFQQVRGNGVPFPYPRIRRQLR